MIQVETIAFEGMRFRISWISRSTIIESMILVTGAAGKTGRSVVRALTARSQTVRGVIRRPEQGPQVEGSGAVEVVVADLAAAADLQRAMQGVSAVYFIAPNMHPAENRLGAVALAVAAETGVERFVYHSVLHPQTRAMPHHWQKLAVEEKVFESEMAFTILQPAAYMQNILPYWESIVTRGVYRVPYGEKGALSLVDLEDVAEVAARVVTETGHEGATYELAGPEALAPEDIVRVISEHLGREIEVEAMPIAEWEQEVRSRGLSDYAREALAKMFRYYDQWGLRGCSKTLEWLLERSPTTFEEFVTRRLLPGAGGPADSSIAD